MEDSFVYKLIKNCKYPFIVRQDRIQLYKERPDMDYVYLFKRIMYASTAGYFLGSFFKIGFRLAFLFSIPLFVKFIYDQYQLKKQGLYQKIYFSQDIQVKQIIKKIKQENKENQQKKKNIEKIQETVTIKQFLFPQKPFTSVKDFVNQLPLQYFK